MKDWEICDNESMDEKQLKLSVNEWINKCYDLIKWRNEKKKIKSYLKKNFFK